MNSSGQRVLGELRLPRRFAPGNDRRDTFSIDKRTPGVDPGLNINWRPLCGVVFIFYCITG